MTSESINTEKNIEFIRVVDLETLSAPETSNQPLNTESINSKDQEENQNQKSPVNEVTDSTVSSLNQSILIPPVDPKSIAAQWGILPLGIQVSGRARSKNTLVRGMEDGSEAIQFDDWLVPYDKIIKALNIKVTNLPNGEVQLRSPTVVFNFNLSRLRLDPEIGPVLSIRDIKDWFGVNLEFDINNYALQITLPLNKQSEYSKNPVEVPIDFTNIPYISAPLFSVTTINNQESVQKDGSRSQQNRTVTTSGSFKGGAWLLRLNQTATEKENTWRLGSASYTLESDSTDLFVGSQTPFWRSTSSNSYWGVTTVNRWGFTMSPGNGGSANNRAQPLRYGQTVRGKAAPGTLVQILPRYGREILGEVLVDKSGEYRFDDISLYEVRLLLYAQGKLTSEPEERIVALPIIIGQLPPQAASLILSAGIGRNNVVNSKDFLGTFEDLRTAVSYRYGVSQELTVGLGASYEDSFRGFTELFFQPENTPLQITASALTPTGKKDWEIDANIRYNPNPQTQFNFNTNLQASRLNIGQSISPNLSVFGNFNYDYNSTSPFRYNIGTRSRFSGNKISASLVLQWDSLSKLQWYLTGRSGDFELTHFGNDSITKTNLTYNMIKNHSDLVLNYQKIAPLDLINPTGNSLLTLSWRLKPEMSQFELELGYGIGSKGSGFMTKFSREIFSGLFLEASYSNIDLGSNADRFRLVLSSCFDLQRGFCSANATGAAPKVTNGILLKPFFDENNNNFQDVTEPILNKKLDLLLTINNYPISKYQPQVTKHGIVLSLAPGLYRLDLDPSGYPLDWYPTKNTAVAIEVKAGGFTEVVIPFAQSYTMSGIVTDLQGKPISGARVEAVASTSSSNQRVFSITSSNGMYYLEGLVGRNYNLFINSMPAEPKTIDLGQSSEPYQQINLRFISK
ncbi:carboxypeptidase-like regulatory domain-containing protein [Sphaerospermopsis torques-reginae]|uniref:Carboxypeptidase regulatory-like domain-containing protein n=1 Tax=Sphaerospermopsis torques-reginae ITEP-024 TaxID=984208 RepID=A0ABX8X183_9CYAN|nr:carboxypeptidase-like regulatory domain-containing protein [Sphaerospermopsis torques-reginae]QYX32429.1 hypothetical protein K2F26_03255 [Sphaerospermopsis torques-reginae ITEP-024]